MKKITTLIILLMTILTSCSDSRENYKIAVSQCGAGRWRDKINSEMLAAQHLYEHDVKVDIVNAFDDTKLQIKQIDSLANADIDLLVVAPNESAPLAEAIIRTQQKGIPVIFFDRKAETDDYAAFIGGDNVVAGKTVADYVLQLSSQFDGKHPVILEITGTMETSPAQERHKGFSNVIANHPEIQYYSFDGKWSSDSAYQITKKFLSTNGSADIIFCHSDFMAVGINKAAKEAKQEKNIKIVGIDGMPDEGITYVQEGLMAGSYIYPTHGEQIVRLALNILSNKSYDRDNGLKGMMVTPENADLIGLNSRELMKQNDDLVTIQDKLEYYFGLTNLLNKIITIGCLTIILLVVGIIMTWKAVKKSRKINQKMKTLNEEQTLFYTNASHQLKTPLTLIAGPVKELLGKGLKEEQQNLLEIVSRNVTQLEKVTSSVLNFHKNNPSTVDDNTVLDAIRQSASSEVMKESRLAMLKQEDTEELPSILIVDDNDDMRAYLRTLLADKFYVQEAADGQSGLRLARDIVPDIVVSDVMMPVMDGLQFCRRLKEDTITSHIPVILLTARSSEDQQIEGYEHGADAYLTKPFSASLLISRIYNLVKSRQKLLHLFDNRQDTGEELQPQLSSQDKLFADALKEAIKKNMSNPSLKMDDLGDELGLSRVQLYRKVKALTGLSPVGLLRQMRLQRGHTLLTTTTKTVNEIAYEVGFGTPGYFSKCFKEQFGKYPMELRAE